VDEERCSEASGDTDDDESGAGALPVASVVVGIATCGGLFETSVAVLCTLTKGAAGFSSRSCCCSIKASNSAKSASSKSKPHPKLCRFALLSSFVSTTASTTAVTDPTDAAIAAAIRESAAVLILAEGMEGAIGSGSGGAST